MLTPKATFTNRCSGIGKPMRSRIRFISTSGTIPRVPPPSMHRTPAPAVGGFTLTATSLANSCPQRKQRRMWKTQGSPESPSPKMMTQFSQIQCPQDRPYCGLLRRQQRQVLVLWIFFHSPWKRSRVLLWMSTAGKPPSCCSSKRERFSPTMRTRSLRAAVSLGSAKTGV